MVGVACCCCIPLRLALMLVLTFASCTLTFAPCTLTFAPCACGDCHWQQLTVVVFLPQPLAQIPHLHTWWFHPLQLVLVVFILPPTGEDTGGFTHCYLRWWCLIYIYIYMFGTYGLPQISICSSKDGRPSAAPKQLHFVRRWRAAPQGCTLLRRHTAADGCWGQVKRTDQQPLNSRRWCWGSEKNGPATLEQPQMVVGDKSTSHP